MDLYELDKANKNNHALLIQLKILGVNNLSEAVDKVRKMNKKEKELWLEFANKVSNMDPKEWAQDLKDFKYSPPTMEIQKQKPFYSNILNKK